MKQTIHASLFHVASLQVSSTMTTAQKELKIGVGTSKTKKLVTIHTNLVQTYLYQFSFQIFRKVRFLLDL